MENALAKQLGVSRASVREALAILTAEKLVTITPNRGPAIARVSWEDAANIYDVRALLEPEAAALSATRRTAPQLKIMRDSLRDFERAIPKQDVGRLIESTATFYEAIFDSCGNPVIAEVLRGLVARIGILRVKSMSQPGRPFHSLVEMRSMLEAIEREDATEAHKVTLAHVQKAAAAARENYRRELIRIPEDDKDDNKMRAEGVADAHEDE